ncbi:tetratricopeptide repeat protein [Streptomyces sp. NPDC005474]|uniref:tetratricopeptide repeat protein n=1 Tax=Streptomyces sp. NPDC005474 TaxID=3154878 RepID=UPI003454C29F
MERLHRTLAWVGAIAGALLATGLIALVVGADLDTASKVASMVGTIAGVVGLAGSASALKQGRLPWRKHPAYRGLINLPPQPGPNQFVGREQVLASLDKPLEGPTGMMVQVVHGLGGIGKSTLAAYWAGAHSADYLPIWWVSADSPAALEAGLASLATALEPDLSDVHSLDLEALQERAVQWLATNHGWLVILDDVNDPEDIHWLLARIRGGGRFLITSRRTTGWRGLATPILVDVLSQTEAVALLTSILNANPDAPPDGTDELCSQLGGLPLAVEQAAAFIVETDITPRFYLDLLNSHPDMLWVPPTDSSRTIARIWLVAQDQMADEPLTTTILQILAWYAPDAIPRTLLDGLAEPPALLRAVGRLVGFSMLTTGHNHTLNMHRLVQTVARTPDPEDPDRQRHIDAARIQATTQLANALPTHRNTPADWPTWRALLPHIEALAEHAPPDTGAAATARLLVQTASFLHDQNAVILATVYLQRALTEGQRLGEGQFAPLPSRNGLVNDYWVNVDLEQALPVFERTLTDSVHVFGEDAPATLTSRNNLAGAYRAVGDLGRAIPVYQRTLTDRERVLGIDHPATVSSRSNLAGAYQAAGDLVQAVPLFERTLTDSQRVFGNHHPLTEAARSALAAIRSD